MPSRQIIKDTLSRKKTPRIPIVDMAFWPETVKRWEGEGLPAGADLDVYFGLDKFGQYYPNDSPQLPTRVIEENSETAMVTDEWGGTLEKWKKTTATPIHRSYGIKDISEAGEYMRRYEQIDNKTVDAKQFREYQKCVAQGDFIAVFPMEPAWFIIEHLLGFEEGIMAFLTNPGEVTHAMRTLMNYSLGHICWLIEEKKMKFDALYFSADLCFKNGMLFSPQVYRDHIMPIHREYRKFCDEHDMFLMLHCDGDVREFIPLIIESGFQAIEPLEARAGNDVRLLKPLYGDKITFFGNINADIIASGTETQIREEVISKVNCAKQGGGYMYHIDHSVPPTISLDNYRLLNRLLKENGKY